MTFSIESEKYKSMEQEFDKTAEIIKKAINADRQIIIRHHGDCDGLSAGLALENVCKELMTNALIKPHFNLSRFSCKAPYYDFSDFLKDFNTIKRFRSRKSTKALVIITDNGSTEEDLFAIKCLKETGAEIIVIDHHIPNMINEKESENCKYLSAHINPHLFGAGSELSAGMLCFELANKIIPQKKYLLPAIAGLDDRIEGPEIEEYVKKSNLSKEELLEIARALDFMIYNSRYDLDANVFEELFYNKDLVKNISNKIKDLTELKLRTIENEIKKEQINNINFISIDIENYSERFSYPRTGKIVDLIQENYTNSFVIGIIDTSITIRQSEAYIPINDLIKKLKEKIPLANVKGGGHAVAGTISFIKAYNEKIVEEIKELLKKI